MKWSGLFSYFLPSARGARAIRSMPLSAGILQSYMFFKYHYLPIFPSFLIWYILEWATSMCNHQGGTIYLRISRNPQSALVTQRQRSRKLSKAVCAVSQEFNWLYQTIMRQTAVIALSRSFAVGSCYRVIKSELYT